MTNKSAADALHCAGCTGVDYLGRPCRGRTLAAEEPAEGLCLRRVELNGNCINARPTPAREGLDVEERTDAAWDTVYEAIQEGTITQAFGDRLLGQIASIRSALR